MSNPNITTEITACISTGRHSEPINSAVFTVYASLYLNGIRVGFGFASRPFGEMPYVTTDAELRETAFWKEMAEEAKKNAMAEAGVLLDALKTQLAA